VTVHQTGSSSLGAFVIGVVSKEASVERARPQAATLFLCGAPAISRPKSPGSPPARRPMSSMTASAKPPSRPRSTACARAACWFRFGRIERSARPRCGRHAERKGSLFLTRPGLAAHATMLRNIASAPMRFSAPWPPASLSRRPGTPFRSPRRRQPHAALEGGKSAAPSC